MIRNFHFKMLMGLAIWAFVMSFIYLSSALGNSSDRVGAPVGGLFSMIGFFAAVTAGAIRSINRRLDRAGIPEDSSDGAFGGNEVSRKAGQSTAPNPSLAGTSTPPPGIRGADDL